MGRIHKYICSGCGEKYSTIIGIGMMNEMLEKRMLEDIRDGKYGQEWKKLVERKDFCEIDTRKSVYICPECGRWKNEEDGSLYFMGGIKEILIRRCECGAEMERDSSLELCCPKCGVLNTFGDAYNWD